jgi:hypothetical protein
MNEKKENISNENINNENINIVSEEKNIHDIENQYEPSPFNYLSNETNNFDDLMFDIGFITDYDMIYHNINVIKNIKENDKLVIRNTNKLYIDNTNILPIRRYVNGDNRHKTVECLNNTILKAIKNNSVISFFDENVIIGLNNLMLTYKNDENIMIQIINLINLIKNIKNVVQI